jgi:hypothetical protein
MVHLLDPTTQRNASLAGVYIMGFYNVPWVLALSLQTSNTGGTTKKSFVSVSIAIFYGMYTGFFYIQMPCLIANQTLSISLYVAVGNIIGPQFFLESQSPRYPLGIGAMLCCFSIMAAMGILYFAVCFVSNQRRDREYGKIDESEGMVSAGLEADREDLTDRQNTRFRYTY